MIFFLRKYLTTNNIFLFVLFFHQQATLAPEVRSQNTWNEINRSTVISIEKKNICSGTQGTNMQKSYSLFFKFITSDKIKDFDVCRFSVQSVTWQLQQGTAPTVKHGSQE